MITEVSVIIVVRNEENNISACIKSIELQFEKKDNWELIIIDGQSTDKTKQLANEYLKTVNYKWKVLDNEKKTLAPGWNIGIKNSNGKYVVRPDAHSRLHKAYVQNGVVTLENIPEVTAVGGVLETRSKGFWGNIIKIALSSRIGVGNSSFRTASKSGFTDTVVYGVYRKEVFDKVGFFDEKLVRHQDNEMHQRIKKAGGKFYLNAKMKADYYCRDSVRKLSTQMFNIGRYLPDVMFNGSLSIRHLAPFAFFTAILFSVTIGLLIIKPLLWISLLVLGVYFLVIFSESVIKSFCNRNVSVLLLLFIIPLIHVNYAIGTFWGLLKGSLKKLKT
jgi:glycosyltransferase involved in cell wall biosynthesis